MLTLREKLLLLALHDDKGHVVFSASMALPYGLAGALLLELYLAERIALADNHVLVTDSANTGNQLQDEVLALISASEKQRDIQFWLSQIDSKINKVQQRLAEELVSKGVLSKQQRSFLWVFDYTRYPTHDVQPELEVRAHIKHIVLDGATANEQDIALLSLINACELIGEIFDKDQRQLAKQRVQDLVKEAANGQVISKAVAKVTEEITVALLILITASTVTTTVVS